MTICYPIIVEWSFHKGPTDLDNELFDDDYSLMKYKIELNTNYNMKVKYKIAIYPFFSAELLKNIFQIIRNQIINIDT